MWRRSRTRSASAGFTILEALVSLIILVVVMTAAMSLLFSMKSFAAKQQSFVAPRQTSRAGLDYLTHYIQGAGDLNVALNNPDAFIMWYLHDAKTGGMTQATYNNLTGAESGNSVLVANKTTNFGDFGTDIISVVIPTNPALIPIAKWPGLQHASTLWVNYSAGCPNNQDNLALFGKATGAAPWANPLPNAAQSGLLTLVDANGTWVYFQITSYQTSDCSDKSDPPQIIHVVCNPGGSGQIDPPSGHSELTEPVKIAAGLDFVSFRIRTDPATGIPNLEQKNGPFDPNKDNPGTAFFPIVENVEDLQIAYIYGTGPLSGQIFNTAGQAFPATVVDAAGGNIATHGVPTQATPPLGTQVPGGYDVRNVIGLRVSVTARSMPLPLSGRKLAALTAQSADTTENFYYRPDSEDHWNTNDGTSTGNIVLDYVPGPNPFVYHHRRYTTTLMVRNKALGS